VVVVGSVGSVVVGPPEVVVWRVVGGRVVAPPAAGRVVVDAWMLVAVVEADTPLNPPSAGATPGRVVDAGTRRAVVGVSDRSSG